MGVDPRRKERPKTPGSSFRPRAMADAKGNGGEGPTQWDSTSKIAGYLDRHLVFPLLEFLQTRGIYPEGDIMKSKIELLKDTNMVDFAMDIYRQIHSTGRAGGDDGAAQGRHRELAGAAGD